MKKLVGILFVILFLSASLLTGAFFLLAKNSAPTFAQTENIPSAGDNSQKIFSFRGVLHGILREIAEETENVSENIRNPFSSAPDPAPTQSASETDFSFAVIGDTQYFDAGNPQGNFQKVVSQIKKFEPGLVISTGDLIHNCTGENSDAQDYAHWKNILGNLSLKTYAVQGNHDRVEKADKCDRFWTDAFNFPTNGPDGFAEFAYSLDFKNSHFVFLDSNKPDAHQIGLAQRNWLDQDLARNKKENAFVIFHEPAYPVSDKASEGLDADPSQRNALWAILEKHNVTAVFNGHEHIVSRRKIGNTYQFVFGSTDSFDHGLPAAGVAEYSNQGQGRFGIVKVSGKEITVETHGPDGGLLDSFTFSK